MGRSNSIVTTMTERAGDMPVVVFAAALMIVSGVVHLHLWDIAYRHVHILGPLFLVQAVAALVAAVVLAATRMVAVLVGSALLMLGTIVGFILATTVGIFNFTLHEITGWAYLALGSEGVSAVLLAAVLLRRFHSPASPVAAT
jgi:hypothetical protein